MVTFVPEHLTGRRSEATVGMLLDHLFYIAKRIGWEHVGLGSDSMVSLSQSIPWS